MHESQDSIKMVDLQGQYNKIKPEMDLAIQECIAQSNFINGPQVKSFQQQLELYLNVKHVVPCANGTDALQIALMALGLDRGDEVIIPAFTYAATAEVALLLGIIPKWIDVDPYTFTLDVHQLEGLIGPKTKAIIPVHLYGQCANMDHIHSIAQKHGLFVIEDAAQALGALYTNENGSVVSAGCIGEIGCTSFFPSKNLGCFGDGGALFTNNDGLASKIRMIANHGQRQKYQHELVGVNSRLDTLQAAILEVKLKHLSDYTSARQHAAANYDKLLEDVSEVTVPKRSERSTHVFHQYTLKVSPEHRNALQTYLGSKGIPSVVYYPIPLHLQPAYRNEQVAESFPVAEDLSKRVLSLPMHTELTYAQQEFIVTEIKNYFSINHDQTR